MSKAKLPVANLELLVAKSKFEVMVQFCLNILMSDHSLSSGSSICSVVVVVFLESRFIYLFDNYA